MTGRKVRVGLDIDGVLYRWQDTAIYLLETYRHVKLSYDDWTYWDYVKDMCSREDWKWLWGEAITQHGLFRYGSLYKGSREFLEEMEPYCDNVIITSRPPQSVRDTMDWLSYQKIPTSEIHVIGTGQKKSQVLPYCDVYIDDALHNMEDLKDNTSDPLLLMPDRPWNQASETGIIRFHDWNEVKDAILITHEGINAGSC